MQTKEKVPFLRTKDPLFSHNCDMLVIALSLLVIGTFLNGVMAVYQSVICALTSVVCEYVASKLVLKDNPLGDLSALSTGLVISLFLPACAPFWLGITACAFAIIVAKFPFGGKTNTPFVPAACGICFVSLCFPQETFTYASQSYGMSAVFSTSDGFAQGTTLLDMLSSGTSFEMNLFGKSAVLSGYLPGAIGTTSMLAVIGVFFYILLRKPTRILSSAGYIVACAAFAAIFPRITATAIESAILEISAGSLALTALIFINDPATSPEKPIHAVLYGIGAGIICMLLRRYAKISDPSCFSVMIINAVYPVFIHRNTSAENRRQKKQKIRKRKIPPSDKESFAEDSESGAKK